jgi:predicted 3-demethylubiquinone-9 3-methyltransferase (glyoxalase superfamily)
MQKISPCLWFDNQAEEAANFYVSVFSARGLDCKVTSVQRYGASGAEASGQKEGTVMTATFQLDGQDFMALNGGPIFKFTEAVSFMVECETQEEIDYYWNTLTANGGAESQCGWLKDKFGLSWQIVPPMSDLMNAKDPVKAERMMKALFQMKKIDIATLKKAYDGE